MTDEQRKAADERTRERIRSLLADRFGLVAHRETKEQAVYLLTVAKKNGPKPKEVTTPADRHETSGGRGRSRGSAAKVEWLAGILSNGSARTAGTTGAAVGERERPGRNACDRSGEPAFGELSHCNPTDCCNAANRASRRRASRRGSTPTNATRGECSRAAASSISSALALSPNPRSPIAKS